MTDVAPEPLFAAEEMADPLLDLLGGFIQELRDAGLPVSLTENLDAMEAVSYTHLTLPTILLV